MINELFSPFYENSQDSKVFSGQFHYQSFSQLLQCQQFCLGWIMKTPLAGITDVISASRIVVSQCQCEHMTSAIVNLHWLCSTQPVDFTGVSTVHTAQHLQRDFLLVSKILIRQRHLTSSFSHSCFVEYTTGHCWRMCRDSTGEQSFSCNIKLTYSPIYIIKHEYSQ